MSGIAAAFSSAFRDYITDGVPASGAHNPAKADLRALGSTIGGEVEALADEDISLSARMDDVEALVVSGVNPLPNATGTIRVRSTGNVDLTSALQNGDTLNGVTLATGDHVFLPCQSASATLTDAVTGATDSPANGVYTVVASGTASRATFADSAAELDLMSFTIQEGTVGLGETWMLPLAAADITLGTTGLAWSRRGVHPDYATEVEAARGDYSAVEDRFDVIDNHLGAALQTVGRSVAPITGSAFPDRVFSMADAATLDGTIYRIRAFGMGTGTAYVKIFELDGTVRNQVGSDVSLSIVPGALSFDVSIPIAQGQYPGIYAYSGGAGLLSYTSNTADGTGWVGSSVGAGNVGTISQSIPTTSLRLEIGFDLEGATVNADAIDRLETAIDNLGGGVYTAPKTFYLFLVVGQSNAVGQASDGTQVDLEDGLAYMWDGSNIVALADPSSYIVQTSGGSLCPAFANELYRQKRVGSIFVNAAVNGSSLVGEHWADTGPGTYRQNAIDELDAAKAALDVAGFAWQFGGVLFVQGETDGDKIDATTITVSDYETGFDNLLAFLQTETDAGSKMPLVLAETGRYSNTNTSGWQAIRAAQRGFCRDNANVFLGFTGAYNFYSRGLMADTYHYKRQGYDEMGTAMASAAASVCLGRC